MLALTLAGSVLAALAESLPLLIAGRVLQGAATAVFPLAQAVLRAGLPAERLPAAIGTISGTLAFGTGLALAGAGLLTGGDAPDYHRVFWLAAAVSALSLLAVAVLVPPSRPACGGHTDWRGAAGLTVALVLLLFPLSRATVWGWASGWTSGCLAASAVAAMFWVRVEPAGSPTSPRPPAASPTRPTSLGDSPPRSQPRTTKLDVLVNNAGTGFHAEGTERQTSADGYELRLAVNYLASVALTRELLPLLHRATPSRIVNIASMGQQPVHLDDPQPTREYTDVAAYRRSKLALICPTVDLAEELSGTGITVNSLHPATFMPTNMSRQTGLDVVDSLEQGVAATRRLVDLPELAGVTGRYFDGEQEGRAAAEAYDREYRRRLAAVTESLL